MLSMLLIIKNTQVFLYILIAVLCFRKELKLVRNNSKYRRFWYIYMGFFQVRH